MRACPEACRPETLLIHAIGGSEHTVNYFTWLKLSRLACREIVVSSPGDKERRGRLAGYVVQSPPVGITRT